MNPQVDDDMNYLAFHEIEGGRQHEFAEDIINCLVSVMNPYVEDIMNWLAF